MCSQYPVDMQHTPAMQPQHQYHEHSVKATTAPCEEPSPISHLYIQHMSYRVVHLCFPLYLLNMIFRGKGALKMH